VIWHHLKERYLNYHNVPWVHFQFLLFVLIFNYLLQDSDQLDKISNLSNDDLMEVKNNVSDR